MEIYGQWTLWPNQLSINHVIKICWGCFSIIFSIQLKLWLIYFSPCVPLYVINPNSSKMNQTRSVRSRPHPLSLTTPLQENGRLIYETLKVHCILLLIFRFCTLWSYTIIINLYDYNKYTILILLTTTVFHLTAETHL